MFTAAYKENTTFIFKKIVVNAAVFVKTNHLSARLH